MSELTSAEIEGRRQRIETLLLESGRWAIRGARIIGYFPYTVITKGGKRLAWRPLSISTAYSTLIFIAGIAWLYPYHLILHSMEQLMMLRSPTECFANALLSYSQQAISQKLRIDLLFRAKSFLSFWHTNIQTLEEFTRNKYLDFLDSEELGRFRKMFFDVGRQTRIIILVLWALAAVQFITTQILLPSSAYMNITIGFWCFTLYWHPGYAVWASYFPRVYAVAFKVIRYQLDRISSRRQKLEGRRSSPNRRVLGEFECLTSELSAEGKEMHKHDEDVFSAIVIPQIQPAELFAKFQATGSDPLRIQVLSLRRQVDKMIDNGEDIEEIVSSCIQAYYMLDAQVKSYAAEFGKYLMFNILQEIVVILTYWFFMFMWGHKGYYIGIVGAAIPLFLYSSELYFLATVADSLQVEAHKIVNILNFLPFDQISPDLQAKVHLLAIKVTAAPPKIEPCSYFTLNRNLITSILSALTMYLIVLVQFENADDGRPKRFNATSEVEATTKLP